MAGPRPPSASGNFGPAEPESRELERSDGRAMICNMTPLYGGKVLVSYIDITER